VPPKLTRRQLHDLYYYLRLNRRVDEQLVSLYRQGTVWTALEAAQELEKEGLLLEVVDLRTLLPYDEQTVLASVRKCSKVILLHEDTRTGGMAGELAALMAEKAFEDLDGPIVRVTTPDTPVPFSPPLEEHFLSNAQKLAEVARKLASY
jgi:2-oxoisovalerate dehydrogenase E1 component beta subunit